MKTALTIAASDSSCGAGAELDTAVFRELGVYPLCAITNVTAQNSRGVHKIAKLPTRIIAAQIDAVARDFGVDACKIGMLFSPQIVEVVAERIRRREIPNVVLDPVMNAKGGEELLRPSAAKRMKRRLMPLVALITPNALEAQTLTGMEVGNMAEAREAAKALVEMGARAALVKGGHLKGEPVDVLYDGRDFREFAGKRLEKNMHGAGCALSAAIAARLALGDGLLAAVEFARQFVERAMKGAMRLGKGRLDYYAGCGGQG